MRTRVLAVAFVGLAGGLAALATGQEAPARAPVRVGVYDSRAVAVAWAASEHMGAVHEQARADMAEAEAEGDEERVAEIEKRMQTLQRKLHFQGFGEYPVHDLLLDVEGLLPEAAGRAGVDVIAPRCDYYAENVTLVDITLELARLLDDSERTLKVVEAMRDTERVPFETLIDMPAGH